MDNLPPVPSIEVDYPKWWHCAFHPSLAVTGFNMTDEQIYLSPFEVTGIHQIRPSTMKFKFLWAGVGGAYAFTLYGAIYKLTRGVGGTATTWIKISDLGTIAGAFPTAGTTEYTWATTVTAGTLVLSDGIYAVGWLFVDTSSFPNRVVGTMYGKTAAGTATPLWFYSTDGTGTTLPATIATIAGSTADQFYWEHK